MALCMFAAGELVKEFDAPVVAEIVHAMGKETTAALVGDFGGPFTSDLVRAFGTPLTAKIVLGMGAEFTGDLVRYVLQALLRCGHDHVWQLRIW